MKRRSFIHKVSHLTAGSLMVPSFVNALDFSPSSVLNNTKDSGRILVLIKLSGGNDGLNTLIPLDQLSNLSKARPHVYLSDNEVIQLGKQDLGLHPELKGFSSLFEESRMKIVQNVGYNQPDFSHFRSMDIWESASDYNKFVTSGWLGRYIEDQHPQYPQDYPNSRYPHPLSIELNSSSLLLTGLNSFTSFLARDPENFFEIINEFDNTYDTSKNLGLKLDYIQLIAKQSNIYGEILRDIYRAGSSTVEYGNSNLSRQFDIVTKLISGGLNTRIYLVELGGFDTHDTQVDQSDHTKGSHAMLMKQLDEGVHRFMQNMDAIGRSDDVLLMTYSEFGRTIASNGSMGTDHGTAAPLFIFGNKINADIAGKNPVIPENVRWQDNLEVEFDFRQVYSSIMNQWLTVNPNTEEDVLFKKFDQIPIIQSQYIDTDGDGVMDDVDQCNDTPAGAIVDTNGCEIFSLAADTFTVVVGSASCIGMSNGSITLSAKDERYSYTYDAGTAGTGVLDAANNYTATLEGLATGSYNICFSVDGQANYERCYSVSVGEPAPLETNAVVNTNTRTVDLSLRGAKQYLVTLNGKPITTEKSTLTLPLVAGNNILQVRTDLECQGLYFEEIFVSEEVKVYPNPTSGPLQLYVGGTDRNISINVTSLSGRKVLTQNIEVPNNRIKEMDISNLKSGVYLVSVKGQTTQKTYKIIKNK